MRAFIPIFFILLGAHVHVNGQKLYDARMHLSEIDTIAKIACYDLELSGSGTEPWILSNYNIALFYDASAICYSYDSLVLDDIIYDQTINHIVTSVSGTPLVYEDELGFIRAGLSANAAGVLLDTTNNWVPTIRFCFDIKFEHITSANTCVQFDFNTPELQPFVGVPPNIVQEWNPMVFVSDVFPGTVYNIVPEPTRNACFILEENTNDLCSDGLDNDEDGLVDCADVSACIIMGPVINLTPPTCIDTLGSIRISNGGKNAEYSIDGAMQYISDSLFSDLIEGVYDIRIRQAGIAVCDPFSSIVTLAIEDECVENSPEACSDGEDNDGDGLADCMDADCLPMIDQVDVTQPDLCPVSDNGSILIQSIHTTVEYSIDSGRTFSETMSFANLTPGEYYLAIRDTRTQCFSLYTENPVVLFSPDCPVEPEVCDDNIDNDGDGLVDCLDQDCSNIEACTSIPDFYIPTAIAPDKISNSQFGLYTSPDNILQVRRFSIFNRWGGLIHFKENFNSSDSSHYWDGRNEGKYVPSGIYTYVIIVLVNGVERPFSGTVTVLN